MLLAIDTTGPFCSVALAEGGEIQVQRIENPGRGHAERLMPMLEDLLEDASIGWRDVTQVACTTGPGSFTGLRVGLAAARGIALALDCPCCGVSVFDAFAFNQTGPLTVAMDARRDQIWLQNFNENGRAAGDPLSVMCDDVMQHIPEGCTRLAGSAAETLAARREGMTIVDSAPSPPVSGVVGAAIQRGFDDSKPEPLYLRAPDAKIQQPPGRNMPSAENKPKVA